MRKKKSEPREVPIKFVGESKDAKSVEDPPTSPSKGTGDDVPEAAAETATADATIDSAAQSEGLAETDWQAQLDSLSQERSSLYDQLLRRQAEFENFRKRTERERHEMHQRARAEVMVELLPVLDNLERALSSLEENDAADADALRRGVELIHKQFRDALAKFGLQPLDAVGQRFDPNIHEAVASEPSEEHNENTVIEEFQRGYKLGDRLLRPAKVKVASGRSFD